MSDLVFRELRPGDVRSLCELLTESFREEYARQGLDVWKFARQYRVVALANLLLRPLGMDFFQVVVALSGETVVGTMTSFPLDRRRWYQGFGAIHPDFRRLGIYKKVIHASLEGLHRRGAEVGGGEIEVDNRGALRPYRDVFDCEVLPVQRLYMVSPKVASIPKPTTFVQRSKLGERAIAQDPREGSFRSRFQGGFLVEEDLNRSLLGTILRWQLPPITVQSWRMHRGEEEVGWIRIRTHWPARIRCLDAIEWAPGVQNDLAKDALLGTLRGMASRTKMKIRIYAAESDSLTRSICEDLDYEVLADVYPIRTSVAQGLEKSRDLI